ncbi:MAG: DUF5655 domain-containing protein [Chloroflexota bacterium]|nr:DUF5655 domain-containing protein [Chloroflexota bacterium]
MPMSIEEAVKKALDHFEHHKTLNEDNTRALLIDPMLAALGWKVDDFSEVERGYPVFDGTRLDYALKAPKAPKPVLVIEAKALGVLLDDPKHISQTVNYANNEGVRWCVLTNAIVYRTYKTHAVARMDQKLLYEIDLRNELPEVVAGLARLSRDRVLSGELDNWGETIITDNKVRLAVNDLYAKPPDSFLRLLKGNIGDKALTAAKIKESLIRVGPTVGDSPRKPSTGPSRAPAGGLGKKPWTVEQHTKGKPQQIISLYEQLHQRLLAFGSDVSRTFAQDYINYSRKRSFTTVELKQSKITLFMTIAYQDVAKVNKDLTKDVKSIGHFGMGDTRVDLTDQEHLDYVVAVARQAYDRQS